MAGARVEVHRIRGVMIFCSDPDASSSWWSELLGHPVRSDGAYRWLVLPDGSEIGFHPADQHKNPDGAGTVAYLQVGSLDDVLVQVVASGATVHRGPLVIDPGRQIAQIRDPFGAVIGLDGH